MLQPMNILIDIGGTKIRIAGSRVPDRFDEPIIIATPQTYAEAFKWIVDAVKVIAANEPIESITAGVPALLSRDRRMILSAAMHIPDWVGRDFAGDLEQTLGTRTRLENDTELVGLGEAVFGAGIGARIVMYLTVSTGVNGIRIVDGKIEPAVFGTAIGHQYLSTNSDAFKWEDLISGYAIQQKYGVPPRDLGKDSPAWEELAIVTAFGLHNSILHWSPDRIVLGGSMFNEIGISPERVRFHLERINKTLPELPEIVHSSLADLGGLWGGLALLKQL